MEVDNYVILPPKILLLGTEFPLTTGKQALILVENRHRSQFFNRY
jgi:hypothetical protein